MKIKPSEKLTKIEYVSVTGESEFCHEKYLKIADPENKTKVIETVMTGCIFIST